MHDLPGWSTAPTSAPLLPAQPRRAEVLVPAAEIRLSIIPARGTAPRQPLAPSRWKPSLPSSASHSHRAGTGLAAVPAAEPSSPRSSHPHRSAAGRALQETEGWPSTPAPPWMLSREPGPQVTQDTSDHHIQEPLAPDANASQNGYWSLIPALAVSSCSWDTHPGNNLGKTATREHQHKAGVCGEPRERSVLQSAPHPRTRQAAPSSRGAHLGTPRFPHHGSPNTAAGTSSHPQH